MTFGQILRYNEKGYSQIIYTHDEKNRYRIIKNPSLFTQIYYFTFCDNSGEINVKLYPWDRKIKGLDTLDTEP